MSHRLLAVALTAVLIVSAAAVLLSAASPAAPSAAPVGASAPAASTPAAGPYYELYNGYGEASDNQYYPGEVGWGTLTFYVYDADDHDVNVTITDPNATRDGVGSPAFSYEAVLNTTTHSFNSASVGVQYTFPDLPYGGTWVVNFSAPVVGYVTQNITLSVYYAAAASSVAYPQSILPGGSFSLFWWAYLESDGYTLYTHATNVSVDAVYRANGTTTNFFPTGIVQLPVGSWGEWNGTVPLNATANQDIEFSFWIVTVVNGVVAENESASTYVDVGHLVIDSYGLTFAPGVCLGVHDTGIAVGTTAGACIRAGAEYAGYFSPISGLPVTIGYWNGTQHVTPQGSPPTSATTNVNGTVEVTFNATAPFVNELTYPYYDAINWTVVVPGANSTVSHWTLWENYTWVIDPYADASGVVTVSFDHTQYYVGSTATISWSISSSDEAVTGPITASTWFVVSQRTDSFYASGTLASGAQSGTFTLPITSGMLFQTLYAVVFAANATDGFDGYATAAVIQPTLLVTPASGFYTAGSSPSVTATLSGNAAAPAGTTVTWQAYGEWSDSDAMIASGTAALGASFSIPIASSTPPTYVLVDAWAASGGSVLASNTTEMALETGYSVLLGVGTVSSYSDGSYQPGQTVTLDYQVVPIDGTALPQQFNFVLEAQGYPYYQDISGVASSGSIAFTIPSNAPAGTLTVTLAVQTSGLLAGACVPTSVCTGSTGMLINPHPSVLSLELGAGSGLTVGWLILLVIVILVAIVLYAALRRRGGSTASTGGTSTTTPMGPPAPAPSTPPATEWKEPAPSTPSSGDAPPPLPPPSNSS